MSQGVSSAEIAALKARCPSWLPGYLERTARFSVYGPRWVPRWLRWLPLRFGCGVLMLYVRGWL